MVRAKESRRKQLVPRKGVKVPEARQKRQSETHTETVGREERSNWTSPAGGNRVAQLYNML